MPDRSLALSLHNIYETLAISFPTVVEAARGRVTKGVCDQRLSRWSSNVVANARATLEVRGKENLVAAGSAAPTFLVMSNHQSLYDIPVLFCALGANLRMITKKELFRVPIFGKALEAGGFISIDRQSRTSAISSLAVAKQMLENGTHVWIAPEGTRSPTGELLPFKKGGFNLAVESRLPVLPVTVKGSRDILQAKALRSAPGARVLVTIHAPIAVGPYADEGKGGRDRLMADVRAAIASAL